MGIVSQGTVSVLVGCHCPVHSFYVAVAWRRLYGRWPKPWEMVCILLHDIGHLGRDYLDDPREKAEHWRLGAHIARALFGQRGYALCAGHAANSGEPESMMYKADKLSWAIAPLAFILANAVVEPRLNQSGRSKLTHARNFKQWATANCSGRWVESHIAVSELAEQ